MALARLLKEAGVGCPYCHVEAGEYCVTKNDTPYDMGRSVHSARTRAWVKQGMPDPPQRLEVNGV